MVGRVLQRAVAAALLVVGLAAPAAAQPAVPAITVTWLTGPEGQPMTSAKHINDRGLVVGGVPGTATFYNPDRVVAWRRDGARYVTTGTFDHLVTDVSDRGQVVGNINGFLAVGSFTWREGVYTALPGVVNGDPENPRPSGSTANGVNEHGQVLGLRTDWAGERPVLETVVWEDAEVTAVAGQPAVPVDINDRGQAAVNVRLAADGGDDDRLVAAVWRVGGRITRLGTLGGGQSWAQGIDRQGRVAGTGETAAGDQHAFLWSGGRMIDLGTLGGRTSTVGERLDLAAFSADQDGAFNDRGEVAGTSETASGDEHAFLWRGGRMVDLGTLGGATSHATALNNRGQVVGYSETASGEQHAFLWQHGRMVDLGAVAGEGASEATDVNDRGQIVGRVGTQAVLWTTPGVR